MCFWVNRKIEYRFAKIIECIERRTSVRYGEPIRIKTFIGDRDIYSKIPVSEAIELIMEHLNIEIVKTEREEKFEIKERGGVPKSHKTENRA